MAGSNRQEESLPRHVEVGIAEQQQILADLHRWRRRLLGRELVLVFPLSLSWPFVPGL